METRSFQVGETSETGAARVAGAFGSTSLLPSILGRYEWVRKVGQPAVEEAELGLSSTVDCESELGSGFAIQSCYEVGSSSQMAPAMESERLGQFGEPRVLSELTIAKSGDHGEFCCVSGRGELFTDPSQSPTGG